MFVTCMIVVMVDMGGFGMESRIQATGKVLKQNNINYLVDFSKDLKQYERVDAKDYTHILISRDKCI